MVHNLMERRPKGLVVFELHANNQTLFLFLIGAWQLTLLSECLSYIYYSLCWYVFQAGRTPIISTTVFGQDTLYALISLY